ncbi:GNAT family N-acetyltransferase [Parashewanella tropica]|uniref:GNAT family N-acetyltransferase n=1 Tax=Parashewanella tropica TaxID=2547970 RepID=UPI00105AB040|nr:GNAT family N-acetyltransferase [Parashewanella tropica]
MNIALKPINKQNYEAVCDLEVTEEQEDYVASNMWSIVESKFNDNYETRAIYQDEEPVGFFMWVKEASHKISIWRFMIDQNHQNKGLGRNALELALNEIKQEPDIRVIEICYNPENPVAKDFYSSFGFNEIGMDDDNEDMLAVIELETV